MKKIIAINFILIFFLSLYSFTKINTPPPVKAQVKWYTWEEAIEANKTTKKKLFVDVYTQWCGWCKRMDKTTFEDPAVVKYLNEHFYPIKLDAEQREDILFNGKKFNYVADAGRRGIHTLAYSLLDGKMSYPTVVYLTEKLERITISPGFKDVEQVMNELVFMAEERYKNQTWQDFIKERKKTKNK